MRILTLSQMYPRLGAPIFGVFIQKQVDALAAEDVDVTVISPMQYAPWPTWWKRHWRHFSYVPHSAWRRGVSVYWPRYWSPPGNRLHFVEGHTIERGIGSLIERLHREHPFDLIHANRIFPEGFAGLRYARQWGVPLVSMARGLDVSLIPSWGTVYRQAIRRVIRESSGILAVSKALLSDVCAIQQPEVPTEVIYNGVDVKPALSLQERRRRRASLGLPEHAPLLLYVGRLEPEKGTPELLDAFVQLSRRHPDWQLVLVGEVMKSAYVQAIKDAGLRKRVHFLGVRSHSDTQDVMRVCDLFAFPSHFEGVSNAVLEAMASGLPVVASRAGGNPEVLPEEVGRLFPIGDRPGMVKHLDELMSSPALRRALGGKARENVEHSLTWQRNAGALISFYQRLLARSPHAPVSSVLPSD